MKKIYILLVLIILLGSCVKNELGMSSEWKINKKNENPEKQNLVKTIKDWEITSTWDTKINEKLQHLEEFNNFNKNPKIDLSNLSINQLKRISDRDFISYSWSLLDVKIDWLKFLMNEDNVYYSKENNYIIELKELSEKNMSWDIYLNWQKVAEKFDLHCDIDSPYRSCEMPMYDKKRNSIYMEERLGDSCGWYNTYYEYYLSTKKYDEYTILLDWCNNITAETIKVKWNNDYRVKLYMQEKWKTINSVFSYSMTWWLSRNYIFNSNLFINYKDKYSFLEENDNYLLDLEWKDLIIDFKNLLEKKERMKEIYSYFLRLTKNDKDNSYVLNFISNEANNVKNIWIYSCDKNNNQLYDSEYFLKNKYQNWNYRYNISEKYGNKCNLPYIINIYYENWTIEKWEYYIIFDY